MEIALTPEALFWFKVAGWLFIGGGATWALAHIWADRDKRNDWKRTHQEAERERRSKMNHERIQLTDEDRRKLER